MHHHDWTVDVAWKIRASIEKHSLDSTLPDCSWSEKHNVNMIVKFISAEPKHGGKTIITLVPTLHKIQTINK